MRSALRRWWYSRKRRAPRSDSQVRITALAPARYDVALVDERQAGLNEVRRHVEALAPNGIDEGTGEALDRAIGAWSEAWVAAVDTAHLDGQTTVDRLVVDSAPDEARTKMLREAEEYHLAALRDAVERSRQHLADHRERNAARTGQAPEPAPPTHRPSGVWLAVVAIVFAAAADLAAFHQVVSLVMRDEETYLVWLLVCGFTATALFLAHASGEALRDWVERRIRPSAVIALGGMGLWLVLGTAAFVIRLRPSEGSSGGTVELPGGTAVIAEADGPSISAALLFLCLYLSTGLVTAISAYRMHTPELSTYTKDLRAYRRAVRRAAPTVARHEEAILRLRQLQAESVRDRESHGIARAARHALREELGQAARLTMAARIQDPAATNGLLPGRPYPDGRPDPGSPLGQPSDLQLAGPPTRVDLPAGPDLPDPRDPLARADLATPADLPYGPAANRTRRS